MGIGAKRPAPGRAGWAGQGEAALSGKGAGGPGGGAAAVLRGLGRTSDAGIPTRGDRRKWRVKLGGDALSFLAPRPLSWI